MRYLTMISASFVTTFISSYLLIARVSYGLRVGPPFPVLRPQLSTIHYAHPPPRRSHRYDTNTKTNTNIILLQSSLKNEDAKNDNVNDESPSEDPSITTQYYSPNVQLNERIYRYDLEDNPSTTTTAPSETTNEYSFFDEAQIYIRAGSGGQGSSTYKRGPNGQNAQPDGGDGGRG